MLDNNDNPPRTAAESYASATGSSSLRSVEHRDGPIEDVGAAGMNPYQTGTMLLSLMSEWDRASKPKAPTRHTIEKLAESLPKVASGQHKGMVEEKDARGVMHYRKPFEVAERTLLAWHLHELGILCGHLKTLPDARTELQRWLGGPHADRIVADILAWWLEPRCPWCRGVGKRIVEGTGGRSTGKVCWACRFSPTPGERPLPHAGLGRRLLAHIKTCVAKAGSDQAEQRSRNRSPKAEEARNEMKKHAQIAKLRRADEEAKAEEAVDQSKIAQHFAQSLTKHKLRT